MADEITLALTLTRSQAEALIETLNDRVEMLQKVAGDNDSRALAAVMQQKEAVIAALMALESAVRAKCQAETYALKPILDLLSQKTSSLPSLKAAEEESRRDLAQAIENLAQAHTAFATSLSSGKEAEWGDAARAIGAEETKLRQAQAAAYTAAERVEEAATREVGSEAERGFDPDELRRAREEAVATLRQYVPLALQMIELFATLAIHADIALADIEGADRGENVSPHMISAVDHLKTALEEGRRNHIGAAAKHLAEALHEFELAAA